MKNIVVIFALAALRFFETLPLLGGWQFHICSFETLPLLGGWQFHICSSGRRVVVYWSSVANMSGCWVALLIVDICKHFGSSLINKELPVVIKGKNKKLQKSILRGAWHRCLVSSISCHCLCVSVIAVDIKLRWIVGHCGRTQKRTDSSADK